RIRSKRCRASCARRSRQSCRWRGESEHRETPPQIPSLRGALATKQSRTRSAETVWIASLRSQRRRYRGALTPQAFEQHCGLKLGPRRGKSQIAVRARGGRHRHRLPLSLPNEAFPLQGSTVPSDAILAWSIIVAATAGVIIRPFRLPEAIWAVIGAGALVLLGLLPWRDALTGIEKGVDVYLFLIGMMLIAELARLEGL